MLQAKLDSVKNFGCAGLKNCIYILCSIFHSTEPNFLVIVEREVF